MAPCPVRHRTLTAACRGAAQASLRYLQQPVKTLEELIRVTNMIVLYDDASENGTLIFHTPVLACFG